MSRAQELYDLIRRVRPLYKALEGAVVRELEGTGLTVTERAVLEIIYRDAPAPVPAIARALILPRQFVQKTVDALAGRGLVEMTANPAHKRSRLVGLSGEGRALIQRVLTREALVTGRVAAAVDAKDLAAARRVIETMIESYGEES